tara:strand:- start:2808 stop:3182 length:375 start_codon:yes stop_codon:yes gene_type:complete
MGLTWPWWYPKDATFEDFFHFLPRRRTPLLFEGSSSETRREIANTERLLEIKEREQEELGVLFDLRMKMKDLQLVEFQVLLEDIFSQTQYFSPLDSNIALSPRFLEMLERIHSLRTLLVEHMGE